MTSRKSNARARVYCSFCGKERAEVKTMIGGPGVNICDACGNVCRAIIEKQNGSASQADSFTPAGMTLAQFKVGQEFPTVTGRWRCTDKGKRTVVAIRIGGRDGRPPAMPVAEIERVFDEDDFAGCSLADRALKSASRSSAQPGVGHRPTPRRKS
jgi:hypothetical protein